MEAFSPSFATPALSSCVCVFRKPGMETDGIEGIAGIEIFGMAGIDGALLNHPPTFDETPENTLAFAALRKKTVRKE